MSFCISLEEPSLMVSLLHTSKKMKPPKILSSSSCTSSKNYSYSPLPSSCSLFSLMPSFSFLSSLYQHLVPSFFSLQYQLFIPNLGMPLILKTLKGRISNLLSLGLVLKEFRSVIPFQLSIQTCSFNLAFLVLILFFLPFQWSIEIWQQGMIIF